MLKGEKVVLTSLRREDSAELFRWINNPETVRFNSPFMPVHETNHASWLEGVGKDPAHIIFAIRKIESPEIVGMLQLIDIHPVHRSAELIIRIGEEGRRNHGTGSEAMRLAIQFAFKDRNLQRVWLQVFANNKRAIRAYEKAGFQQEGILRQACYISGNWIDLVLMAVLAEKLN